MIIFYSYQTLNTNFDTFKIEHIEERKRKNQTENFATSYHTTLNPKVSILMQLRFEL